MMLLIRVSLYFSIITCNTVIYWPEHPHLGSSTETGSVIWLHSLIVHSIALNWFGFMSIKSCHLGAAVFSLFLCFFEYCKSIHSWEIFLQLVSYCSWDPRKDKRTEYYTELWHIGYGLLLSPIPGTCEIFCIPDTLYFLMGRKLLQTLFSCIVMGT
jgi:hypothetical protein